MSAEALAHRRGRSRRRRWPREAVQQHREQLALGQQLVEAVGRGLARCAPWAGAASRNTCSIRPLTCVITVMNSACLEPKSRITYGWETPASRAISSVVVPA